MTFDYFNNVFNRNGYDNAGSILKSYVNANLSSISSSYSSNDNAFWNTRDRRITYGMGSFWDTASSLDIVAYEIGHGVCQYTASLKYEAESGALNEGFSDIWAACVEIYAIPNRGDKIWLIGEDISYWPMRNMKTPMTYKKGTWVAKLYTQKAAIDLYGINFLEYKQVTNAWFAVGVEELNPYVNLIMGSDIVCDCKNQVFTLSDNIPLGDSIIWNSEIGDVIAGQGTRSVTFDVSQGIYTSQGYVQTVSACIYYGRNKLIVEKVVHGGLPKYADFVYDETDIQAWNSTMLEVVFNGATDYSWVAETGNCDLFEYGNKADIRIYDIKLVVTASNRCGSWHEWFYDTWTVNISPGFYVIVERSGDVVKRKKIYVSK